MANVFWLFSLSGEFKLGIWVCMSWKRVPGEHRGGLSCGWREGSIIGKQPALRSLFHGETQEFSAHTTSPDKVPPEGFPKNISLKIGKFELKIRENKKH